MSVLLSYSVVKEPTTVERAANVPDPPVRVKRNVSVLDDSRANPLRLIRTLLNRLFGVGKIVSLALQGPKILGPTHCVVNLAPGTVTTP